VVLSFRAAGVDEKEFEKFISTALVFQIENQADPESMVFRLTACEIPTDMDSGSQKTAPGMTEQRVTQ